MATREENLKKINDELEKLSDEELDNIFGGANGYVYCARAELGNQGLNIFEVCAYNRRKEKFERMFF